MVASIATAKAETLGAFEISNHVTVHSFAMQTAGSNYGAICLACAVVAALGESGALDPKNVIRWAEWMAENQPVSEPAVSEAGACMLRNFAKVMASMMEARPEGSRRGIEAGVAVRGGAICKISQFPSSGWLGARVSGG